MHPKRRPGRPSLDVDGEASTPVNVRLSTADYDVAYARAQRRNVTVPELLRRALHISLRARRDDDERDE